jgi:NAD(P)-dependent dehydrogenase (short-subunit alcohol dehydrogenase family)
MAAEYARRGIRVNVVLPGWIDTPLNDAWVDVAGAGGLAAELERIPLGRMGSPAEVASMITFLASDEASYATGAFFPVDGGQTAI